MRSIDSPEIGALFYDGIHKLKKLKVPKEVTEFDETRLRKAEEKRECKRMKRLLEAA